MLGLVLISWLYYLVCVVVNRDNVDFQVAAFSYLDFFSNREMLWTKTLISVLQEYIKEYTSSLISLEARLVLKIIKDPNAAKLIEGFLLSEVPAEQKLQLVVKYDDKLLISLLNMNLPFSLYILVFYPVRCTGEY